ncbi:MAG: hypothetical protein M0D53_14700 [Flavobacterium sp. JAD_PAG50586_2]|nr:MAG: hypothetical protein M0D53_14700 [Flavobacterium sp. JAD_PAG50586_2]
MATFSETGHAKNIANFERLIIFCEGYGSPYNPAKSKLTIGKLNDRLLDSKNKLDNVIYKNTLFNTAVNNRLIAFQTLTSLSTRVINALEVSDASKETIKDAKGFNRKLQGKRAAPIKEVKLDADTPVSISASQQSYDQKVQHFAGLISVAESEISYFPNENDLTIEKLKQVLKDLKEKNTAVAKAHTEVTNARIERDETLYNPEDGLVETALEVKKYIKSVFTANSQQYKEVKGIAFRMVPN